MFARRNKELEVTDAMKAARDGVPGAREEAMERVLEAKYQLIIRAPSLSAEAVRKHAMHAKYAVHLKRAYPNASGITIEEAAYGIAAVDSHHPYHNSPVYKRAVRAVKRMINEHRANTPLASSLRK